MELIAVVVGFYWLYVGWRIHRGVTAGQPLPPLDDVSRAKLSGSLVSIIVAARDEGERIGETVRSLISQQDIEFELIVVDDRSTDDTAQIVGEFAKQDRRVRLMQIEDLPEGWLGKCHACWQAALQANGDWLLFSDGDAHMSSDLVARAIAKAESEQADHMALLPSIVADRFWTRVALVGQAQLFTLYTSPETTNSDRSNRWVGVGAFNLFDRDTYFAIGGHEAVCMEVVEDMKLGYLVRKNGYRQRAYSGVGDLEVDWATSVRGILTATEKNWFAAMNYRFWTAIAGILFVMASIVYPLFAPFFAGAWGWFALASLATLSISGYQLAKQFGWQTYIAPFTPFGWLVFAAAGIHSIWKTLSKGGIHWRDSFYPLNELRDGVVR